MSNDDMFTWTDHSRSSDGAIHINIVRNISSGNPKVSGKHILPGTNLTSNDVFTGNGMVLPNDLSALFGYDKGYFFIDYSNPTNIVSNFVNLALSVPTIRSVQAVNLLNDNVTVIFTYLSISSTVCFQEGFIQSNGSIALGRNVCYSTYAFVLAGVGVDLARNIVYAMVSGFGSELYILNATSFTTAQQLSYQGAPFTGALSTGKTKNYLFKNRMF